MHEVRLGLASATVIVFVLWLLVEDGVREKNQDLSLAISWVCYGEIAKVTDPLNMLQYNVRLETQNEFSWHHQIQIITSITVSWSKNYDIKLGG